MKEQGASVLFDGYPRTGPQAEQLNSIFRRLNMGLHGVIALILDFEILISRITARRTCSKCGTIVNVMVDALPQGGGCPNCGGDLMHRDDDNECIVRKRIEGYRHETAPLMDYYEQQGVLYRVDGLGAPAVVCDRVNAVVERIKDDAAKRGIQVCPTRGIEK